MEEFKNTNEENYVERIYNIIEAKSYLQNNNDRYFLSDFLQGYNYIRDATILEKLIPHMLIKKISKGEIIYKKGERNEFIYFIVEGKVSQWKNKSREESDFERNVLDQIRKLQKLIDNEKQLKGQDNSKFNTMIPAWQTQLGVYKKQLSIIQKEDFRLPQCFKNEEGLSNFTFQKIYKSRTDIFGYQNTLYNTRPVDSLLAETDCNFLVVKGDDFYKVFDQEIENVQYLIKIMNSQFTTIDQNILQILAQQFNSFYYDMHQEVYQLDPQLEQQKIQNKQNNIYTNSSKESSIAFYIIRVGTVLVKETHNQSTYNICQLSEGSVLGIEKMSPTYKKDFQNRQFSFVCVSNRLQLLGVNKKIVEEVQQAYHSHDLHKTLVELGQQRCQFFVQRLEQIKNSLNTSTINNNNSLVNTINQSTSLMNDSNIILNCDKSRHSYANQSIDRNNDEQANLMFKPCKKNKQNLVPQNIEIENKQSSVHLKSLVHNILQFRPSKDHSDVKEEHQSTYMNNKNRKIKQNSVKISEKLILNNESEATQNHKKSQSISNYINQQSPLKRHESDQIKSKILNQNTQFIQYENNIQINLQSPSKLKQIENFVNEKESVKPSKSVSIKFVNSQKPNIIQFEDRQKEKYKQSPRDNIKNKKNISDYQNFCEDELDDLQIEKIMNSIQPNGDKYYEKFYKQDSFSNSDEESKQNKEINSKSNINSQKKISFLFNDIYMKNTVFRKMNQNQQSICKKQSIKEDISPIRSQQQINLKQNSNLQKQNIRSSYIIVKTEGGERGNQQSSPKNHIIGQLNEKNKNEEDCQKQKTTQIRNLNKINDKDLSQTLNDNEQKKFNQTLTQDQQIELELKLNNDFELKNGKLISKRPPTFAELREDFISSTNPYQQCSDLIGKFQLISDSNKDFMKQNSQQNYKKEIQKQIEQQKNIIRLTKYRKQNDFIEDNIKHSLSFKRKHTQQLINDTILSSSKYQAQNSLDISDLSKSVVNSNFLDNINNSTLESQVGSPKSGFASPKQEFISKMNSFVISRQQSLTPLDEINHDEYKKLKRNNTFAQSPNRFQTSNPSQFNSVKAEFHRSSSQSKFFFSQNLNQQLLSDTSVNNNSLQNANSSYNIMTRNINSASERNLTRKNQQNTCFSKLQSDLGVNIMMLQNLQHSFQPLSSQVSMMPSFEPKLSKTNVNRPKTSNVYKTQNKQSYSNDINQVDKNSNNGKQLRINKQQLVLNFKNQNNSLELNNLKQQANQSPNKFKIANFFAK